MFISSIHPALNRASFDFINLKAVWMATWLVAITCCFMRAEAKTLARAPSVTSAKMGTTSSVAEIEQRLKPFLYARISRRNLTTAVSAMPTLGDLRFLARCWSSLSSSFRDLYLRATSIPSDFRIFVSAGGHFEIYFTTTDPFSAVDPTDTMGYSSEDWRIPLHAPNGIPDYIDEVGWALDSVWSMEIDRFGFIAPLPSDTTRGEPYRYKVVVIQQGDDYYGMTYPGPPYGSSTIGYRSHIEIRPSWKGWNIPPHIDYERYPHKGVRVTCAHEFFHAIQYAMTRRLTGFDGLDDFPLGWLEGTAVLMEEKAFDEINDYLQYVNIYFSNPSISLLANSYGLSYQNCLLLMYLYRFAAQKPSIHFVHRIMYLSYEQGTPFWANLFQTAEECGTTWPELLGRFHAASYFTGNRTDTSIFLPDAAMMPQWSYPTQRISEGGMLSALVEATSMHCFAIGRSSVKSETLVVTMNGWDQTMQYRLYDSLWNVNLLLIDTVSSTTQWRVLPLVKQGSTSTAIADWSKFDVAFLVVSNSDPVTRKTASVSFNNSMPPHNGMLVAYPNPLSISRRHEQPLLLVGEPIVSVLVYSTGGQLVSHVRFGDRTNRMPKNEMAWRKESPLVVAWYVENQAGIPMSPGMHYVVATTVCASDGSTCVRKHKILLIP